MTPISPHTLHVLRTQSVLGSLGMSPSRVPLAVEL